MSGEVVYTWRDVAALHPVEVGAYVQAFGPLPDGPVTEETWKHFWAWLTGGDAE